MAEALGLVASLVALGQLAHCATNFGSMLYKFSRDAGAAKREIQNFANNAKTFAHIIIAAEISLRNHCSEHGNSAALAFVANRKVLADVAQQSRNVRMDLKNARERIKSFMKSRYTLIVFFKWEYQKSSITVLFPAMESIKASLNLMLSILTLETLFSQRRLHGQSDNQHELNDQIESMKRLIQSHITMMQRLQHQLRDIHQQSMGDETSIVSNSSYEELRWLGMSMVETGHVPGNPRTSTPPPASHREAQRATESPLQAQTQSQRGSHRPPTVRHESPRAPARGAVGGSRVDSPTRKYIELSAYYASRATDGYVKSPSGRAIPVTANLDPTATGNVIGLGFARQLGLEVEAQPPDERVFVNYGTRNMELSVGRLTLYWRMSADETPHRPPIKVECSVVENRDVTLVLGKQFMEQRKVSWRRSSSS